MERHIVEDLSTAITLVLLIQCRLSNDVFKSNINFHWSPNHPRTIVIHGMAKLASTCVSQIIMNNVIDDTICKVSF